MFGININAIQIMIDKRNRVGMGWYSCISVCKKAGRLCQYVYIMYKLYLQLYILYIMYVSTYAHTKLIACYLQIRPH